MNDDIMNNLNNPTLLKSSSPPMVKRIILPKTSNLIKELIRLNVTEGKKICRSSGISGTAEKQKEGHYLKHSNYWEFIYSFPMTAPKYTVYYSLFLVRRKQAQKLLDMLQQVECCSENL